MCPSGKQNIVLVIFYYCLFTYQGLFKYISTIIDHAWNKENGITLMINQSSKKNNSSWLVYRPQMGK